MMMNMMCCLYDEMVQIKMVQEQKRLRLVEVIHFASICYILACVNLVLLTYLLKSNIGVGFEIMIGAG